MTMSRTEMTLSSSPARTIWSTVRWPVDRTIAFGGVAAGNMNAQLAAMAMAVETDITLCPASSATAVITGRNAATVAVLLASSVMETTMPATARRKNISEIAAAVVMYRTRAMLPARSHPPPLRETNHLRAGSGSPMARPGHPAMSSTGGHRFPCRSEQETGQWHIQWQWQDRSTPPGHQKC